MRRVLFATLLCFLAVSAGAQELQNPPSMTTIGTGGLVAGRIPFAGTAGRMSQDSFLVWDSVNRCLTIGGGLCSGVNGNNLVVESDFVDPPGVEDIGSFVTVTQTITADTGTDILGLKCNLAINQNGHHLTSQHASGCYAAGYGNGASGTIDNINGFTAISGNQAAGTVTKAVDFRAHVPINSGGGTLTTHYAFFDEGACNGVATNCYGAGFANRVAIRGDDNQAVPNAAYTLDVQTGDAHVAGNVISGGINTAQAGSQSFIQRTTSSGTTVQITGGINSSDDQGGQTQFSNVGGGTAGSKWIRITHLGNFQVMNNAYSTAILDLADNGNLALDALGATFSLSGGTSGTTALQASATASGTLTLPAATDTMVARATTDTLTHKTLTDVINQEAHEGSFTSNTSSGFTTITGLDQTFTSAGVYSCNGHMHFTTAPTTSNGVKLQLASDGTSSITTLNFNAIGFNSAAFATSGTGTATALGSTAISSQNAFTDIILNGEIVVNAGGVIHVQFNEVATSGTIAGNARWDCHRAA